MPESIYVIYVTPLKETGQLSWDSEGLRAGWTGFDSRQGQEISL
jgi:hypothetical protein